MDALQITTQFADDDRSCCIDKRNSAELTEAINSMFEWYSLSISCFAYLADVEAHHDPDLLHGDLARARWFTRGWTLQELLAPTRVEFYARDWKYIGDNFGLRNTLMEITGIPKDLIIRFIPSLRPSVAMVMSWAAKRNTSRIEDMAYCLLGIFSVNMPLLYGEGGKAFRRLQEEIMKANPTDHSLFAWGRIVDFPSRQVTLARQLKSSRPIPWKEINYKQPRQLRGLFADSPRDFEWSADFSLWGGAGAFYTPTTSRTPGLLLYPTITGAGVTLELPVLPDVLPYLFHWPGVEVAQLRSAVFAILFCQYETARTTFVLLPLYGWGDAHFGRLDEVALFTNTYSPAELVEMRRCLKIVPESVRGWPTEGEFLLCRWGDTTLYQKSVVLYSFDGYYIAEEGRICAPERENTDNLWALHCRLTKVSTSFGFGLVFARAKPQQGFPGLGALSVSLVPLVDVAETEGAMMTADGFTWISERHTRLGKFESMFCRSMAIPEDTWRLDVAPFPLVEVYTKRQKFINDMVDVVHVVISERPVEAALLRRPRRGRRV